jgi:hypothetical protein
LWRGVDHSLYRLGRKKKRLKKPLPLSFGNIIPERKPFQVQQRGYWANRKIRWGASELWHEEQGELQHSIVEDVVDEEEVPSLEERARVERRQSSAVDAEPFEGAGGFDIVRDTF